MLNRRSLIAAFGIVLLTAIIIFSILSNDAWLAPENIAVHIVINNRTNQTIGPFEISEHLDTHPLRVNQIEPFSVADVYYIKSESWGENAIVLRDSTGKNYEVIPYFENDQKGRVDIRVECVTPDGLSGKIRQLTSWYFSFEWASWGTFACK